MKNSTKTCNIFAPGRVIQSLNEDQSQEFPTPLPRHNTPEDVRLLFTKRKEHLDHQCEIKKSNPVEPFINDPSHLLVLPDRNVVWCPVFKAGSSTWLSIILDLSSVSKVCFLVPTPIGPNIIFQCLITSVAAAHFEKVI